MADLRDRETAVSEKNDSPKGPSGTRKRDRNSLYLLVGGSKDTYDVTVNFETKNGHWCQTLSGNRCHGNGNGKGQKYGPPQSRDKRDPQQWCKHVQAALGATEHLAEAEERTAAAFGEGRPIRAKVQPAVPAFKEPVKVVPPVKPVKAGPTPAERLKALEAESAALRATIRASEDQEITEVLRSLLEKFDYQRIEEALFKVG
jgi:hypothetical protein